MSRTLDICVSAVLLAIGVAFLAHTFSGAFDTFTFGGDVGPAFAPRLFLTAWVIFAATALLQALRSGAAEPLNTNLPQLLSVAALIVALPFIFGMSTEASIALFVGIYVTSVYGGSISAILINTPGTPQSAATVLDGYPMAKSGRADLAIGWATFASLGGGLFSLIVLIIAAPVLAKVSIAFGPATIFAIIIFALTCIAWVSTGSTIKGLLAGVIGLWLTTVGSDDLTGVIRFDFDLPALRGGLHLIPVPIGLFALAEVLHRAAHYFAGKPPEMSNMGFKMPPWPEIYLRWPQFLRASSIGTFIGILPGAGATAATFVSYSESKRTSPRADQKGDGEPDALVASETANNAVTGGALIPTLPLGSPGDGGSFAEFINDHIAFGILAMTALFVSLSPLRGRPNQTRSS
ncbi:tripartite tricarboxylate transporter permease [Pseudooctadecabacter jejudonensis]|uniref:Tripartite tricarboxylate transporter TctA family protein n=1 Tax=Pseudooctadecabacter jejudonensis TaxID=1391910 RepID=A0A1Y5SHZ1_9RHOB|nr:tripartite tricarboxylate transporter permease [Pseudooctadecabacter jejudonensis]SLN41248.1 Tripartite tricarboxylate transporter TctA family protein [Pseudooctadecabacter jejudonensis]